MLFEVEQAANRIRAEVDPDANIIFGNTILDDMEGRIRVSVVATGIDAELIKMPLPDKVRTAASAPEHHASRPGCRSPRPYRAAAAVLGGQSGACQHGSAGQPDGRRKEPGRGLYPGRRRCPGNRRRSCGGGQVSRHGKLPPVGAAALGRRASRASRKRKSGWGFFGRKKVASDMRAEPHAGTARSLTERPAPRATAQPHAAPMPQPQGEPPRNNADDLFPDHKRDEQFEIPAFLRRQSN